MMGYARRHQRKRQTSDFNLTQAKTSIQGRIALTRPYFSGSVATKKWNEEQHYAKIGKPVSGMAFPGILLASDIRISNLCPQG